MTVGSLRHPRTPGTCLAAVGSEIVAQRRDPGRLVRDGNNAVKQSERSPVGRAIEEALQCIAVVDVVLGVEVPQVRTMRTVLARIDAASVSALDQGRPAVVSIGITLVVEVRHH